MPVYIIRHALKVDDRKQFPVDDLTPLSSEGIDQLAPLGMALRSAIEARGHKGKCTVLTSPQLRSQQTRDGIMPYLNGLEVSGGLDGRLVEISRGKFYNLSRDERHEQFPVEASHYYFLKGRELSNGLLRAKAPGGEDMHDLFTRTAALTKGMKEHYHADDPIVLITSNCPARAIPMHLLNKPHSFYLAEPTPDSASIRVLEGNKWRELKDGGYIYGTARMNHADRLALKVKTESSQTTKR